MATWLFIGTIFGVALLLAFFCGRSRNVQGRDDQCGEPAEGCRRVDVAAADASRMADARTPPFQGGGSGMGPM
jgi:hypothetical protein